MSLIFVLTLHFRLDASLKAKSTKEADKCRKRRIWSPIRSTCPKLTAGIFLQLNRSIKKGKSQLCVGSRSVTKRTGPQLATEIAVAPCILVHAAAANSDSGRGRTRWMHDSAASPRTRRRRCRILRPGHEDGNRNPRGSGTEIPEVLAQKLPPRAATPCPGAQVLRSRALRAPDVNRHIIIRSTGLLMRPEPYPHIITACFLWRHWRSERGHAALPPVENRDF